MRPNSKSAQIKRLLKRVSLLALAVLSAAVISPAHGQSETAPKKVIIDTDPGTDDALAILLAVNSPELDIRAITIVAGNVTVFLVWLARTVALRTSGTGVLFCSMVIATARPA